MSDHALRPPGGEFPVTAYVERVVRRWYIVVLAIVAAVLLVLLRGISTGDQSEASATIYLGQQIGTAQTAVDNAPATNPTAAVQFLTSEGALRKGAAAAGVPVERLRDRVAARIVTPPTGTKVGPFGPSVELDVRGPLTRRQVTAAVSAMSEALMTEAGSFQRVKKELIEQQITTAKAEIESVERLLRDAQRNLNTIATSDLSPVEKATVSSTYATLISGYTTRIGERTSQLSELQLNLRSAEELEDPSYLSAPESRRIGATTTRSGVVVAAIIGLIIGAGLALAWDRLREPSGAAAPARP
jgi:hypothetical protein